MMKTKNEYIADVRQFKERFASKYGSDLDVFVELEEADPFTMFDIRETLESLCGCKVDLLRLRKGLRDLLLKRIEQDGIYI